MSPYNKKKCWSTDAHIRSRVGLATSVIAIALCLTLVLASSAYPQDVAGTDRQTRFEGYPDAPTFSVVSRKDDLFFYPCDQCHAALEPNPEIRELNVMHDAEIDHGRGRIWCMSCHDLQNRDYLKTLLDEPVGFDDANLVCGGCHSSRHRDWVFGVHGKRVETWQGERTLYDCAHCHNPHNPVIEPRAPVSPPPVRAGLELGTGEDSAESEEDPDTEDEHR